MFESLDLPYEVELYLNILMVVLLFGAIGYVMNIVKIFMGMGLPVSSVGLLRVVGVIVVPIGCVVGYL